jgi:hypothetical protein
VTTTLAGRVGDIGRPMPVSETSRSVRIMEENSMKFLEIVSRADKNGLVRLVTKHLGEMTVESAIAVMRSPFASRQVVESLCSNSTLLRSVVFRREVVAHRATGEVRALRLLPGLGWRDLIEIVGNVRIRPTIRRSATLQISSRLPGLAVGERVIIARRASPDLIKRVLGDVNHRVIAALLENPKLTELVLMPVMSDPAAPPKFLNQISDHPLWNRRRAVQRALCRNPRTPPASASSLLAMIGKQDLRAVAADSRIEESVRAKARALLGDGE